jgi:predicted GNAT family acetyltransferase
LLPYVFTWSMRCIVDPDLPAFAAEAVPWLHRDPVRHNVLCTITQSKLDGLLPLEPDALWLRLVNGAGELAGAAVQTPPRGLLLSTMSETAAELIADHLATIRGDLPAVEGPEEPAAAFAGRFTERTDRGATKGLSARMYRLDEVTPPNGVPGRIRGAIRADRELLIGWLDAFGAEALAHQPRSENAPMVDSRLEQGGFLWLWEDGGVPVSLLMVSRPEAGVVRVGAVYTPPELRGHGYASGNVAAICQRALNDGARACMLYADRANPTSNRIYQRIGFHPTGDTQEWVFTS